MKDILKLNERTEALLRVYFLTEKVRRVHDELSTKERVSLHMRLDKLNQKIKKELPEIK